MNQPRMPSPAILVAVLALVAALAGTAVAGPDASTSAITKKKVKKIATKQANKVFNQRADELQGAPGPQGPRGLRGQPGQDATNLSAYIRDFAGSPGATGNVEYGDGVTAVSDPDGNSAYTVSFNQSVENCVVQAVPGVGDPPGTPPGLAAVSLPTVNVPAGDANDVDVTFRLLSGVVTDTAFLITAFC